MTSQSFPVSCWSRSFVPRRKWNSTLLIHQNTGKENRYRKIIFAILISTLGRFNRANNKQICHIHFQEPITLKVKGWLLPSRLSLSHCLIDFFIRDMRVREREKGRAGGDGKAKRGESLSFPFLLPIIPWFIRLLQLTPDPFKNRETTGDVSASKVRRAPPPFLCGVPPGFKQKKSRSWRCWISDLNLHRFYNFISSFSARYRFDWEDISNSHDCV